MITQGISPKFGGYCYMDLSLPVHLLLTLSFPEFPLLVSRCSCNPKSLFSALLLQKRERFIFKKQRVSHLFIYPRNGHSSQSWARWNPGIWSSIRAAVWMVEAHGLDIASLVFPDAFSGSLMRSRTAVTPTSASNWSSLHREHLPFMGGKKLILLCTKMILNLRIILSVPS